VVHAFIIKKLSAPRNGVIYWSMVTNP